MSNVIVEYSDFSKENSQIEKITFELLTNVNLEIKQITSGEGEEETKSLTITMTTEDNENQETTLVSGTLDNESINALIRSLLIFRNQLSSSSSQE